METEEAYRREGFLGGEPVELGDGNAWYVPLPRLDFRPTIVRSIDGRTEALTAFGLTFDRLIDAAQKAESFEDEARALLALAVDLLGRNYDLPPDRYRELLRYFPGEVTRNGPLLAIYEIATGDGPKTFAGWVRLGAILSGADPDRLTLRDAYSLAQIQVALGRFIPADHWVDDLNAARQAQSVDDLGAC